MPKLDNNVLKVKISCAGFPSTSIKNEKGFSSISKFLPNNRNRWENCEFFINEDIENPDFWLIIDNIESDQEECFIQKNKVFFLSAEVPFVTSYFDDGDFLNQFYKIFSSHPIYNHNNIRIVID